MVRVNISVNVVEVHNSLVCMGDYKINPHGPNSSEDHVTGLVHP